MTKAICHCALKVRRRVMYVYAIAREERSRSRGLFTYTLYYIMLIL